MECWLLQPFFFLQELLTPPRVADWMEREKKIVATTKPMCSTFLSFFHTGINSFSWLLFTRAQHQFWWYEDDRYVLENVCTPIIKCVHKKKDVVMMKKATTRFRRAPCHYHRADIPLEHHNIIEGKNLSLTFLFVVIISFFTTCFNKKASCRAENKWIMLLSIYLGKTFFQAKQNW